MVLVTAKGKIKKQKLRRVDLKFELKKKKRKNPRTGTFRGTDGNCDNNTPIGAWRAGCPLRGISRFGGKKGSHVAFVGRERRIDVSSGFHVVAAAHIDIGLLRIDGRRTAIGNAVFVGRRRFPLERLPQTRIDAGPARHRHEHDGLRDFSRGHAFPIRQLWKISVVHTFHDRCRFAVRPVWCHATEKKKKKFKRNNFLTCLMSRVNPKICQKLLQMLP